jgi:hypothetical protein
MNGFRYWPVLAAVLFANCAQIPLSNNLPIATQFSTPSTQRFTASVVAVPAESPQSALSPTTEITALSCQTNGQPFPKPADQMSSEANLVYREPLITELAQTSFMRAYVKGLQAHAQAPNPNNVPKVTATVGSLSSFLKVFSKNFGNMLARAQSTPVSTERSLDNILAHYYADYFDGKYVTRDGVALAKPSANVSFNNNSQLTGSINTDTLTGILTVFWEALLDYAQDVPVFSDANGYLNGSTARPTCLVYGVVPAVTLPDRINYPNITVTDWKSVRYLSIATSLGSQVLASLIVKSIGGFEAGPVFVLGKFSVGDNTTLTQIIETTININAARDCEYGVYHILMAKSPQVTERAAVSLSAVRNAHVARHGFRFRPPPSL